MPGLVSSNHPSYVEGIINGYIFIVGIKGKVNNKTPGIVDTCYFFWLIGVATKDPLNPLLGVNNPTKVNSISNLFDFPSLPQRITLHSP